MATFFRGAGPGNHWNLTDARIDGFTPQFPGGTPSLDAIIRHIRNGSAKSPYLSFTRSFSIARTYGLNGPGGFATKKRPRYVYEIELTDDTIRMIDPLVKIAERLGNPLESRYQHDGGADFLLGVVAPEEMKDRLEKRCEFPPGAAATSRPANLSAELESMVRALRDAEVLVVGNVPHSVVRNRFNVYTR